MFGSVAIIATIIAKASQGIGNPEAAWRPHSIPYQMTVDVTETVTISSLFPGAVQYEVNDWDIWESDQLAQQSKPGIQGLGHHISFSTGLMGGYCEICGWCGEEAHAGYKKYKQLVKLKDGATAQSGLVYWELTDEVDWTEIDDGTVNKTTTVIIQ